MHKSQQTRPIELEGTSLALVGAMPIAPTTSSKHTPSKDAPPAAPPASHGTRNDAAAPRLDPRAPETRDLGEDTREPYDNVACTD